MFCILLSSTLHIHSHSLSVQNMKTIFILFWFFCFSSILKMYFHVKNLDDIFIYIPVDNVFPFRKMSEKHFPSSQNSKVFKLDLEVTHLQNYQSDIELQINFNMEESTWRHDIEVGIILYNVNPLENYLSQ